MERKEDHRARGRSRTRRKTSGKENHGERERSRTRRKKSEKKVRISVETKFLRDVRQLEERRRRRQEEDAEKMWHEY